MVQDFFLKVNLLRIFLFLVFLFLTLFGRLLTLHAHQLRLARPVFLGSAARTQFRSEELPEFVEVDLAVRILIHLLYHVQQDAKLIGA